MNSILATLSKPIKISMIDAMPNKNDGMCKNQGISVAAARCRPLETALHIPLSDRPRKFKEVLRRNVHLPIAVIGKWLGQVVREYFNHHAVPTNAAALNVFRCCIVRFFLRTLRRRSQKDAMTWERIKKIADEFLPIPKITHPWPNQRFAVRHPRWEPYA